MMLFRITVFLSFIATTSAVHGALFALEYDSLVSSQVAKNYKEQANGNELIDAIAKDLSVEIATDIIQAFAKTSFPEKEEFSLDERSLDLDQRCYHPAATRGIKCSVDHIREGGAFSIDSTFYKDGDKSISARLDVLLNADDQEVARMTLVSSISKIQKRFLVSQGASWKVVKRQSPVLSRSLTQRIKSSISDYENARDVELASLDYSMLANNALQNRMLVYWQGEVQVWQYESPLQARPIRNLYIGGVLQSTTGSEGRAHAEAMVHPTMTSQYWKVEDDDDDDDGLTILVLSKEPLAILRELLKHKSISTVFVLGYEKSAVSASRVYLKELDDCSFLENKVVGPSCSEHALWIDQPVEDWLQERRSKFEKKQVEWHDTFVDAVFIDVPVGSTEWLKTGLHDAIYELSEDETMVVFGAGSPPSFTTVQDDSMLPRDLLARHVVTNQAMIHLYDEPLAKPLPSTFVVSFVSDNKKGAKSYGMFVRKNDPAIDVDLINSMDLSMETVPTLIYDGSTHHGYLMMSRAWEHWFCRTEYGRKLSVCTEFLPMWYDSENHRYDFEVRQHSIKGRSLHSTKAISKGQFVIPNDAALSFRLDRQRWEALNKFVEDFPQATLYKDVRDFVIIYGFESEGLGVTGWAASIACNSTFSNHACTDPEENVHYLSRALQNSEGDWEYFAPPVMRHAELLAVLVEATRDIPAGEEIQTDYSTFRTAVGDDESHNKFLATMCQSGEGYVAVDASNEEHNEL